MMIRSMGLMAALIAGALSSPSPMELRYRDRLFNPQMPRLPSRSAFDLARPFRQRPAREPSRKTKGRTGARARVEARKAWNAGRR